LHDRRDQDHADQRGVDQDGDRQAEAALVAVLDPEVVLRDHSAGLPAGATMQGARAVGAFALSYSRAAQFVQPALVEGSVGLAIVPPGRLIGALGFTVTGDTITEIEMISDPGRLRHVDLAAFGE
jgi:hypothetical protein